MASDRTFQCPNCGSPLTATGPEKEIKCTYCGSTVIVPESLRVAPQPQRVQYDFRGADYQNRQTADEAASGTSFSTTGSALAIVIPLVVVIAIAGLVFFIVSTISSASQPASQAISIANGPLPTAVPLPTATPTPPIPTPAPFTKVLFKDNFASSGSGWPRSRNPKYTLEYKDGKYHVVINEQGQGQEVTRDGEGSYANASVEVDVQQTAGPSDGLMGVTCRDDNNGNFYSFEFSQNGTYGIFRFSNGSGDALDEQTLEPNPVNQNDVNHIEGVCDGDTLTLLLNGQVLSQVQDSAYTKGAVGMLVRTGSSGDAGQDVLFSNLVVKGH